MTDRRFRNQNSHHLSNAQPVQQQIYPSHQMPYNEYYHLGSQANANGVYSRPTMTSYDSSSAGYSRRVLNPNAAIFVPSQQAQPANTTLPNYASAYYMQPVNAQQQIRGIQQQVQQVYDPNARLYTQSQSPIQQQFNQPSKYQQVSMSQNSQPTYNYAVGSQQNAQYMQSYNGVADFQQQQLPQNEVAYTGQFSQFPISNELVESIQNSNNVHAIMEVMIGLESLVTEPAEYELWSSAIKTRIASGISKEDASLIGWLIVEMSYMGENVQYSFAKLCKLLDSEIKNFTIQYVVPRVASFTTNGVQSLSPEHLTNYIVFLAELYDKTEVNGTRIARFGEYIVEQISIQLSGSKLNDQIVKSAVQVLKLVGRHIEDDNDPQKFNRVFEQMNALQNCSDLSSAVKNNIRQLNQLRERNWGITKNEDFMNGSMNGSSYQIDRPDGVVYGPDGLPLSEEERLFLEESCQEALDSNYQEMDAEAMAEYEKYENFLQSQTEETAMGVAARALERCSLDDEQDLVSPQRKNMQV